jgi:hypothetical protein
MAQKRKTAPPTRVSSRSSRNGRSGLIAKEKTEKQSAKRRTALDNRFHRTSRPSLPAATVSDAGGVSICPVLRFSTACLQLPAVTPARVNAITAATYARFISVEQRLLVQLHSGRMRDCPGGHWGHTFDLPARYSGLSLRSQLRSFEQRHGTESRGHAFDLPALLQRTFDLSCAARACRALSLGKRRTKV